MPKEDRVSFSPQQRSYTEMYKRKQSISHVPEELHESHTNDVVVQVAANQENQIQLSETEEESTVGVLNPNHKIGYKDILDILKKSYNFDETTTSTSLDILALYLKGQKIIYTESKTYCEKHLNRLMLPAILLAAICAILNFILKDYSYGTIIISSFNAVNSFILSIINYLKLAEKSQNHLMAAQRFQSLESRIELESGRSMFFQNSVSVQKTLEEIEKEIKEIQSSNQFIVPEAIRYRYPKIYASNIFSVVKQIKNEEIIVINNLKTAAQDLHKYTNELTELDKRKHELLDRIEELKGQQFDLDVKIESIEFIIQEENPITITSFENKQKEINMILLAMSEDSQQEYSPSMPLTDLPANYISKTDTSEEAEKKREEWFIQRKRSIMHEQYKYKNELDSIKLEINDITHSNVRLKSEKIENIIRKKQNIKIIDQLNKEFSDIEEKIKETELNLKQADDAKNIEFKNVVKQRQKYINLNKEMNKEIDKHIYKIRDSCRCNPCDFFNT